VWCFGSIVVAADSAKVFTGWRLLWLAYQSTGVIYGDIGTSPLYVYSSTFTADPSYDDLLGALSLIIWSLSIVSKSVFHDLYQVNLASARTRRYNSIYVCPGIDF
jgi:hypothetical protein